MIKRSLPSQKPREQQMSTQDGRNQKQLYPEQDQPDRPGNPGPGQGPDDPEKNAPSRENPAEPQDPEDDEGIEEDLPEEGDQEQPKPIE